jgi:nitrous oxidase accessory protein NosD
MRLVVFVLMSLAVSPAFALSCGEVVTRDTVLTTDLDCPQHETALTVSASGITLDFAGHSIRSGSRDTAVMLDDVADVRIVGPGRIEGAMVGIEATRTEGLVVQAIEFVSVGDGVRLHNSSRAEIASNRFDGVTGHAIVALALPYALTGGGAHRLHDNVIEGAEYGVLLDGWGSGDSLIAANRFERIGSLAIHTDRDAEPSAIVDNAFGEVGVARIAY